MQLAWRAVVDETAAATVAVLESLIVQYGASLVVKSDSGSAVKSDQMQKRLKQRRIVRLPFPSWTPQYNGSCQATDGSVRRRTNYLSVSGNLGL
jgi:hypothetical protein